MNTIRGVLFDIDGTLINSNDAHAHAWVEALSAFEFSVSYQQIRELIGKGGDKLLPEVTGLQKDSLEGKRVGDLRKEVFTTKYLSTLKPFPGVQALLQKIKQQGLKLVVATSAQEEEMHLLLKAAGAEGYFENSVSSSDAKHSKPDPDIIRAALDCARLEPKDAIMIGDTPYDIEAARKANVSTIAFRCGGWGDAELSGAIAIYNHALDLFEHYEDSPLGSAWRAATNRTSSLAMGLCPRAPITDLHNERYTQG